MSQVSFRISERLQGLVESEASSRELSKSDILREALREYFLSKQKPHEWHPKEVVEPTI